MIIPQKNLINGKFTYYLDKVNGEGKRKWRLEPLKSAADNLIYYAYLNIYEMNTLNAHNRCMI